MKGSYDESGAIDYTDGTPEQDAISRALETVDGVLAFGRKLHGLGGGGGSIDTAGAMPSIPGNPSDSGRPPLRPQPGPGTGPGVPGFGERMAGRMPSIPGSPSESGVPPQRPEPGPLPPTSNPFGKRADAGGDESASDETGAITDEDEA